MLLFFEPISLTVRSLEHVKPVVGDTAVIVGPGSIGLLHLQALKAAGCSKIMMVGLDKDAHHFEMAKKLGVDHIINASSQNPVEAVMDLTKGLGADIVIETASHPIVWTQITEMSAARGRISMFGLYPEAQVKPLSLIRRGTTVYGDVALLTKHFIRAIRWVEYKKVLAEPIVTHRFKITQAKEALDAFFSGKAAKVLFEM